MYILLCSEYRAIVKVFLSRDLGNPSSELGHGYPFATRLLLALVDLLLQTNQLKNIGSFC